jgi:hypothetical protein
VAGTVLDAVHNAFRVFGQVFNPAAVQFVKATRGTRDFDWAIRTGSHMLGGDLGETNLLLDVEAKAHGKQVEVFH